MMKKSKSNPWMRSKALYVIPVTALALSAFATPKFIAPIESAVSKLEGKSTENVDEKLISFKADDSSRFLITIPKGTWVEQNVDGENSSYIEENTTKTPYLSINSVTIKLDGKVVDVNDLCDMPASILKKFEKSFPEREINLVTTTESADKKIIEEKEKAEPLVFINNKRATEAEFKKLDQKTIASIDVLSINAASAPDTVLLRLFFMFFSS